MTSGLSILQLHTVSVSVRHPEKNFGDIGCVSPSPLTGLLLLAREHCPRRSPRITGLPIWIRGCCIAQRGGAHWTERNRLLRPRPFCQKILKQAICAHPRLHRPPAKSPSFPKCARHWLIFNAPLRAGRGALFWMAATIGTVICPAAEAKLFVTASAEVRAERRYLELTGNGMDVTRDEVLADVKERDARDMERAEAPLKPCRGCRDHRHRRT
ncbi:Cytidylate kinase [Nymphon striatum]|nr:Cytidylate kinase [Nymphon striatum]